jgi:hypothetical protein
LARTEGLKTQATAPERPNTPYDDFMESQGVPIYRGIGSSVQDMPMKPWSRMGGKEPSSSCSAPKANGAAMWSKHAAR